MASVYECSCKLYTELEVNNLDTEGEARGVQILIFANNEAYNQIKP